jgi:uncharacterized membrane protein YphA (DoxX/SURF4 family)
MLNPFPHLLVYSAAAPDLLRIAAGIIFAYLAYRHYQRRGEIAQTNFPIVGRGVWIAWVAVLVELAVALALLFGFDTQYAAIVGAIGALKHMIWRGKYPAIFWLTRSAAFLLMAICLSLLLTGAGACILRNNVPIICPIDIRL